MKEEILRYALDNAIKFNGKANPKAIIGKIFQEHKNINIKKLIPEIEKTVKEVNSLTIEQQQEKLSKLGKVKITKKTAKEGLKPLKKAKNIIMRGIAPSPSGPLHIGHALGLSIASEYCKKYKGKLILRIEDTNPENIYSKAYNMIPEEANWLTQNNIHKVIIQSDRIPLYYKYLEKLIDIGGCYICTCSQEEFKNFLYEKTPCPCRNNSKQENKKRWKNMFNKYKQGDAVIRVKTDLQHKNPAMRDFPIARINETKHSRQKNKYKIWPLMNFSVFVDDVELGLTHILRGKDHADNAKRQEFLYNYFKKPIPQTLFHGRINFTDMQLSSSKTRKLIEEKKYTGWDDIRLSTLVSLKRRGYSPESIVRWAVSNFSLTDKKVSKEELFKSINSFNREIIDSTTKRYFFIEKPKKITIKNAPKRKIKLKSHPEKSLGFRNFEVNDKFYIEEKDYKNFFDGSLYRLMDCLNFTKYKSTFTFDSLEYKKFKGNGKVIIHWLPQSKDLIKVEILMPDNTLIKGIAESNIKNVKVNEVVQMERFGFTRCDKKTKDKITFWFAHK